MSGTITRIGATGAGTLLALGLFAAPPAGATGSDRDGKGHRTDPSCFTAGERTQGRSHSDPDGMSNGGADKPGCTGGFDADRDGNNGCGNDADREDDNNGRCGGQKGRSTAGPSQRSDAARVRAAQVRAAKVKAERARVEAEKKERSDDSERGCNRPEGSTTTTTAGTAVAGVSTAAGECTCPVGSEDQFTAASTISVGGTAAGGTVEVKATALDASATAAGSTVAGATVDTTTTTTVPAAVEAVTASTPSTSVLGESITRPSALARTGAGVGGLALVGGLLCGGGRIAILARRFLRTG